MGFFSKLFKADDETGANPEAPQDGADEGAAAAQAPAGGGAAPALRGGVASDPNPPPPPAAPSAKQAPARTEREAARPPALRSPVPPAPPPPLGATAVPAGAPALSPLPAAPPPPPAGTASGKDGGKDGRKDGGRGSATRSAANASRGAPKPATPPMPAGAGVKVGGAAVKRSTHATIRGLPAVQPVATGARAPEQREGTISSNEAPAAEARADAMPAVEPTAFEPAAFESAAAEPSAFDLATVEQAGPDLEAPTLEFVAVRASQAPGESLDSAIDAAVDRLIDPAEEARAQREDAATQAAAREADKRAAAETFRAMLAAGSAQLRELVFQLSVGRTPRHWAASCRPVVTPFLTAARAIELSELSAALEQFDAALERAASESSAYVGPDSCSAIEQAYARLAAQLPEAFGVPGDGDQRRLQLIEALLLQVPALHRRTLNKLYGAGLGSLEQLCGASAEEIAAVAGIDHRVAEAITERVHRFEQERSQSSSVELRAHVHGQLRSTLTRLAELQAQFERAELDEAADRKREARRGREVATYELELLLSEIGELSLIEDLRRCAVTAKIRRIEGYLDQAQAAQ